MKHSNGKFAVPPVARVVAVVAILLGCGGPCIANASAFPDEVLLSALDGTSGFTIDGAGLGDLSGISVSAVGDFNGDGIDDLIVGAIGVDSNGSDSGSSYVIFGRDAATNGGFPASLNLDDLDGFIGFRLDGELEGDLSGRSVSAAGDINFDGIKDLIIGAHRADPNGRISSGRSYVVFGRDTFSSGVVLPALNLGEQTQFGDIGFRINGAMAGDESGRSVSAAGDINGDGIDDLIVGAPGADAQGVDAGSAYVVFGRDTATVPDFFTVNLGSLNGNNGFRLDGGASGDRSGISVSAAGDVNGDGIGDLIVGAGGANSNGDGSGSSYVVFGRDTATAGEFPAVMMLEQLDGGGFAIDGEAAGDFQGGSVSAAGDVNGDGIGDLIVGADGADSNGDDSGSSYVVFGRGTAAAGAFPARLNPGNLDGSNGFRIDGEASGDNSGAAVSAAGDINADGIDDLIVGAPLARGLSGTSYVVFGRDTAETGDFPARLELSTLDGVMGFRLVGEETWPELSGFAVAAAGDINRDGIGDLIIGAWGANPNGTQSGRSYVVFGGVTGPGEIPRVLLQPHPLAFGDVDPGGATSATLIVENTGNGALAPGTIAIEGVNAADFTIDVNGCAGAQLAKGEFCGIDIEFAPTAPGLRRAMLKLESNAPSSPDFAELRGSNDVVFADGYESD